MTRSKKTKDRDNCLLIASYYGHLRICELILFQSQLNGPSSIILNSLNLDGNTSLHKAALTGQLKICNLLLVYDVDFTIKNKSNETAQDLAARNNQQKISLLLNEKSDMVGESFTFLICDFLWNICLILFKFIFAL